MAIDRDARKGGRRGPPQDPRGGHTRLHWNIQDSPAWQALAFSSQCLWLAMRRQLLRSNNGKVSATKDKLAHHQFKSSATVAKGLRELQVAGFIQKTRQGGIASGGKLCCLYRFTDEAVVRAKDADAHVPEKPTNDWEQWKSIDKVKSAIASAHRDAKRPGKSDGNGCADVKVQKLKRVASGTEADGSKCASETEPVPLDPLRNLKRLGSC